MHRATHHHFPAPARPKRCGTLGHKRSYAGRGVNYIHILVALFMGTQVFASPRRDAFSAHTHTHTHTHTTFSAALAFAGRMQMKLPPLAGLRLPCASLCRASTGTNRLLEIMNHSSALVSCFCAFAIAAILLGLFIVFFFVVRLF